MLHLLQMRRRRRRLWLQPQLRLQLLASTLSGRPARLQLLASTLTGRLARPQGKTHSWGIFGLLCLCLCLCLCL
jgi:hypothetical protein